MEVAMRCGECAALERCRQAFNRYWEEKSHGGKGCRTPIRQGGAPGSADGAEPFDHESGCEI